jgi:hypothetical protein
MENKRTLRHQREWTENQLSRWLNHNILSARKSIICAAMMLSSCGGWIDQRGNVRMLDEQRCASQTEQPVCATFEGVAYSFRNQCYATLYGANRLHSWRCPNPLSTATDADSQYSETTGILKN